MTFALYDAFAGASELKDEAQKLNVIKHLCQLLPKNHSAFLHLLLGFLNNINKAMTVELGN